MRRFIVSVTLAVLATIPALAIRLTGLRLPPVVDTLIFGVALLGAGFLLSWGAETAEEHVSQGLALAGLALVTILPEYAVDIYYTLQAGRHPGSDYVQFAAANMTGANRLLIGIAWPLIVLLFWWRSGRRAVALQWGSSVEIVFLGIASLYSFVITLKGSITLVDMVVLVGLYALYLWRTSKLPTKHPDADDDDDDDDDDAEVGPAAALTHLPKARQYATMAALAIIAALVILAVAEPFAEALVSTGTTLGINRFLLIQWVAPLASEAPEVIIAILFTLRLRPTAALGALISDKINQWTLLVGMIPLFYAVGLGRVAPFPLDARQHEEFFLTAAQSLFAVALLLRLRLSLRSAVILLGLFLAQFALGFAFHNDEARTIAVLTALAWLYLALVVALFAWRWRALRDYLRIGLLNRSVPDAAQGITAHAPVGKERAVPRG